MDVLRTQLTDASAPSGAGIGGARWTWGGSGPERVRRGAVTLLSCVVLAACGVAERRTSASGSATDGPEGSPSAAPTHVDSIFPMDEALRRFRDGMTEVTGLSSAAPSREELVDTLLRALERADTAGVTSLAITPSEFAWLYFPNTIYVSPPYELPPGLVWFQLQNRSSDGLRRILREHSGKRLYDTGMRCPDDGDPFGSGHIWHGCTVVGELPTGEAVEESLFGSIIEWNGRFKLVSFAHQD